MGLTEAGVASPAGISPDGRSVAGGASNLFPDDEDATFAQSQRRPLLSDIMSSQ